MYRAMYFAAALALGLTLTLGMGALEKHRYESQRAALGADAVPSRASGGKAAASRPSKPSGTKPAAAAGSPAAAAKPAAQGPIQPIPDSLDRSDSEECADDLNAPPDPGPARAAASSEQPTAAEPDFDALIEQLHLGGPGPRMVAEGNVDEAPPEPASEPARTASSLPQPEADIHWETNYDQAWRQARDEGRMLFILFADEQASAGQKAFEKQTFSRSDIKAKLAEYVTVKLPTDAQAGNGGKPVKLLRHPAFAEMLGQKGIAIIDLRIATRAITGTSSVPFPRFEESTTGARWSMPFCRSPLAPSPSGR